jgi:8-oxo-dGTP diphosphatase
VVFQLVQQKLAVLLITRMNQPFAGIHALPGGYVSAGETTFAAMTRIVHAKAGILLDHCGVVEQLYTFDTIARDPRGHAVSVTYMALGRDISPQLHNDTHHPQFFPIDALPEIAFDHAQIIQYAHERLKNKISYTNAIYALLPNYLRCHNYRRHMRPWCAIRSTSATSAKKSSVSISSTKPIRPSATVPIDPLTLPI